MPFLLSVFKFNKLPVGSRSAGNQLNKSLTSYDCIKPVYFMSRIFGLLPFSVRQNSNGSVESAKVNLFDMFWFLCAIGIYLTLSYFHLPQTKDLKNSITEENSTSKSVLFSSIEIIFLATYLKVVVFIILDMLNRKLFANILTEIAKFDKSVR